MIKLVNKVVIIRFGMRSTLIKSSYEIVSTEFEIKANRLPIHPFIDDIRTEFHAVIVVFITVSEGSYTPS